MSDSGTESNNSNVSSKKKTTRKARTTWTENESRSVISIINDLQILKKLDDKKCKKKSLYKSISEKLGELNPPICRDVNQVENHWKLLRKLFNESKVIIGKSGEGAVKFNLYHDMNNLIGNRPLSKALEGGIESEVDLDHSTNEGTGNKILITNNI